MGLLCVCFLTLILFFNLNIINRMVFRLFPEFSGFFEQYRCEYPNLASLLKYQKSQLHAVMQKLLMRNQGRNVEACGCAIDEDKKRGLLFSVDQVFVECMWCKTMCCGSLKCNPTGYNLNRCRACVYQARCFIVSVLPRNFLFTSICDLKFDKLERDLQKLIFEENVAKTSHPIMWGEVPFFRGPVMNVKTKKCSCCFECPLGVVATACLWCKWNTCRSCSEWNRKCDNCAKIAWQWAGERHKEPITTAPNPYQAWGYGHIFSTGGPEFASLRESM